MKTSEDPITSEILHRLVVPIQTRGNLGKSTEAIARCEWMSEHGVAWKGYDLDAFNRTLSTTYPEDVVFVEPGPEPEGELIKIFRGLAQSEVTVIDPSAHMNRTILRAMEMVRLTQLCEAIAARVTVLIYPVDEVSDMDDIAQTVETLGDSVDWVIIRNPVKIPTTKFFQGSELEKPVTWLWSRAAGDSGAAFRHPQSSALAGNSAWTGIVARRGAEESEHPTGYGPSDRP